MTGYKTFENKFKHYFKEYNLETDEKILKDFYIFTDYLLSENEKYNLTSITDIDEIIVKHYIDSIIILKYFDIPENSKMADAGTGAGFPALPLYIMRRDLKITFIDSSNKKMNFIKNALNLVNNSSQNCCNFYCGRAEDYGRDLNIRETYDFAVSRAVAKLNVLCELAAPLIKSGGFFISYKGRNAYDEITESKNALKILGLEISEIIDFDLNAESGKRTLVKIKKLKQTPAKYPRNFSAITKNPL